MVVKRFSFKTLDECIRKACDELNILESELDYKIIEEKNGIFTKKTTIEVEVKDDFEKKEEKNIGETNGPSSIGLVKVENGKIIVKNPISSNKKACIFPAENLKITVDGKEIDEATDVTEQSNISVVNFDEKPERFLNIEMDEKKMEAYITLKYHPQYIYKLKDCDFRNSLKLQEEIQDEVYPPIYTEKELKGILRNKNIVYGIIKENLSKVLDKKGVENLLIAKGVPPIPDEDDIIDIKFQNDTIFKGISDNVEKVDFKNLISISEVEKGQVLAVKHTGKEGKNGVNIFGREVKRASKKRAILKAGQGTLIEGNKVIAAITGKPQYKNDIFYVYPVHEVSNDVDIKSGNIDFIGEVIVHGSIKEGMEVKAQGRISIDRDVLQGNILGDNDIFIGNNIISSKIFGGGKDVSVIEKVDCFDKMKSEVEELKNAVQQIKNLTNNETKDGEVIKLLIENKFKSIPKIYFRLLKFRGSNEEDDEIIGLIKTKLIGLAPIGIDHLSELDILVDKINDRVENLNTKISLPVDVSIQYCQDSVIKSSGNIFVKGKGEYVSELIANDEVCFINENSVARGGSIFARNKIECGIVGSEGGVATKLQVNRNGHIYVKRAYQNTVFVVGNREYILDSYARDIHVCLNNDGDLNIEKLKG